MYVYYEKRQLSKKINVPIPLINTSFRINTNKKKRKKKCFVIGQTEFQFIVYALCKMYTKYSLSDGTLF